MAYGACCSGCAGHGSGLSGFWGDVWGKVKEGYSWFDREVASGYLPGGSAYTGEPINLPPIGGGSGGSAALWYLQPAGLPCTGAPSAPEVLQRFIYAPRDLVQAFVQALANAYGTAPTVDMLRAGQVDIATVVKYAMGGTSCYPDSPAKVSAYNAFLRVLSAEDVELGLDYPPTTAGPSSSSALLLGGGLLLAYLVSKR